MRANPLRLFLLGWAMMNGAGAMVYRVPLPGGRSISFNQATGVLRINLSPDSNGQMLVPPLGTAPSKIVMESILLKDTGPPKGFGAFAQSSIPADTFLGFYEGSIITTREKLDQTIAQRKRSGKDNAMDYVLSLDGGVTFVDGYDRAQDRRSFSPVHLNHADKGKRECNVLRLLEDDRVAFFTSREIADGEELCFDYGSNFWAGRETVRI